MKAQEVEGMKRLSMGLFAAALAAVVTLTACGGDLADDAASRIKKRTQPAAAADTSIPSTADSSEPKGDESAAAPPEASDAAGELSSILDELQSTLDGLDDIDAEDIDIPTP